MAIQTWRHSAMEWNTKNALTHLVRMRTHNYARYRYEDLIRDLPGNMEALARQIGLPSSSQCPPTDSAVIHCLNVNPFIFEPDFTRLRPDTEWEQCMDPRSRRIVTAYTWPLLLTYGYRP